MVTGCVRCSHAAGFWVGLKEHETVRRPWCLACIDAISDDRFATLRIVSFDGRVLQRKGGDDRWF